MTSRTESAIQHECCAYCRGNQHATVVGISADLIGREGEIIGAFAAGRGVRVLHFAPAPEYNMADRSTLEGYSPDGRPWSPEECAESAAVLYSPWLVVWEE